MVLFTGCRSYTMNFNNVFVILHLMILTEIVSSYYEDSNSHKYRSGYGRDKYGGNRDSNTPKYGPTYGRDTSGGNRASNSHKYRSTYGRDKYGENGYSSYRDRSWRSPYSSQSSSDSSWHSWKRHHSITRSKVILPSGRSFNVTNPGIQKHFKCGDKPNLITLNPTGAMGRKEYTMVKTAVENQHLPGGPNPFSGYTIIKIEKIENPCLWEKYNHRRKEIEMEAKTANEHLLFHGSTSTSDIIVNGFDERYARINGAFGAGIYFASHSFKSHFYTFAQPDRTYLLLLCRVALGKVSITKNYVSNAHAPPGYHSVKGDIYMPEYVVYRGEQAYPEFLITYT